ncbi:hypothetical protein CW702_02985 [Candidatus Bathyarchaeota archaeon]|nr:MAG: hypothetical protein CW702_02985 [Candidatus Bathyarchaeota archaeon]
MRYNNKVIMVHALLLGSIYLGVGLLEFTVALLNLLSVNGNELVIPNFPSRDLLGGFSSVVIGLVYSRAILLGRSRQESVGFIIVGSLLLAAFCIVYVLILLADGLGSFLSYMLGGNGPGIG